MRGLRFLKKPWIIGLFAIFLFYKGCSFAVANSWKSSVPQGIQMGRVLASTTDWVAPPGGSCGGAIIQLKAKSIEKIQDARLDFFQAYEKPRNWKSTTISWSKGTSDNRGWISFQCAIKSSSNAKFYEQELRDALSSKTAYYGVPSGRTKTRILVAPSQGLVFVGYWD